MNQSVESPSLEFTQGGPANRWSWFQPALLAGLLGLLYYRILAGMAWKWWTDSNYSHGFIVPIFCAWVIWKERRRILQIPAKPSWFGLLIILGSLGILVLGELGAENFLSRTSLLFLLAGIVIQFRGWRFFRAVLFPWVVLFLMVPLPAIIFNQIALPLQFQASRLASGLLALVGVPVLREGNVIQLPSLTLDVVEACSGLRSLVSLLVLAVFYGYLFEPRIYRRVLLILVAIPIAVVANGFRIMGSGILGQYWDPDKAEGFFHLFSGWLVFLLSLGLVVVFHASLSWLDRRKKLGYSG
jgi:exosortase